MDEMICLFIGDKDKYAVKRVLRGVDVIAGHYLFEAITYVPQESLAVLFLVLGCISLDTPEVIVQGELNVHVQLEVSGQQDK